MKLLILSLAILSSVMAGPPDAFLGQARNLKTEDYSGQFPIECVELINNLKITEYKVVSSGNPKDETIDYKLELSLDKSLFDCYPAKLDPKPDHEKIINLKAYYMNKPNNHEQPQTNIDVLQDDCNCGAFKILDTCSDKQTLTTKLASDACKAQELANPNWIKTKEIPESITEIPPAEMKNSYYIMKTASGSSGVAMTISYHFNYEFYDEMLTDFYVRNTGGDSEGDANFAYEETTWAFIHMVYILQSFDSSVTPEEAGLDWGMTNWWEFELTMRFYLELTPAKTNPFTIIPREIKVKQCLVCVIVTQQTAVLEFVEEKDRSDDTDKCPPYLAVNAIDWLQARPLDKPFCALEKILMRIYIKDIKNSRKFVLQRFEYDFVGRQSWVEVYVRVDDENKNSNYFKEPVWNEELNQLQLEITALTLGATTTAEIYYQAQVRLCKIGKEGEEAWVCDPVMQSEATVEEGGTGTQGSISTGGRRRMLNDDKEVVQQYLSPPMSFNADYDESAAPGDGTTKTTTDGNVGLIIGIVVVVAILAGVGIGVFLHLKKKGASADDEEGQVDQNADART